MQEGPRLSWRKSTRDSLKEFFKAVTELSIVVSLGLFVTFGAENFVKKPAVLLTEGVNNLRLDGLLTLIAIPFQLNDLSLAMRTEPSALIRGVSEFETTIYGPAVTFAFSDAKVDYGRSMLHLNRSDPKTLEFETL